MEKAIAKYNVFMIQEIIGGCAYVPTVFKNEKDADKYAVKVVNEVYDKNFTTIEEAMDHINDENTDDSDHEIKYWTTSFEKKGN